MLRSLKGLRRPLAYWLPILIFWTVMMALLLRKEVFLPRLSQLATAQGGFFAGLELPVDNWMGVYFKNQKVGYGHFTISKDSDSPASLYVTHTSMLLQLPMLKQIAPIELDAHAFLDNAGRLSRFDFHLASGEHQIEVKGKYAESYLNVELDSGGEIYHERIALNQDALLSNSLAPLMVVPALEPDKEYAVDLFDPVTLQTSVAKLRLVKHEQLVVAGEKGMFAVVSLDYQGITSQAWVSSTGEVVQAEIPLGLTLRKETEEKAKDWGPPAPTTALYDLATMTSVPSGTPIQDSRNLKRLRLKLSGIELGRFDVEDDNQKIVNVANDEIEMRVPEQPAPQHLPKPSRELTPFLNRSMFVQSDDPHIKSVARSVVEGETDPWKMAQKLNHWVNAEIKKTMVASVPSAVEVLKTKEGDCNEHTVLYAAMARSVGIPTKIDIGLVYSDGRFYYHAWPEVYVGKWIRIDPTLGQEMADATHIKLIEGEIGDWVRIIEAIGRISIEVTDLEPKPAA